LYISGQGQAGGRKNDSENGIKVREGIERLDELMTDFFFNIRTKSLDLFDVLGGD
jgi:hypothetical protein